MVFRHTGKRVEQSPDPDLEASITGLPHELLFDILDYLPTPDVLRLRQSHSNLTPVCATVLSKRLHCLYINPTIYSLRAAVYICNHATLGREINEVVLLGKVLWRDIEKAWGSYRLVAERHFAQIPEYQRRFRPWPLVFPVSTAELVKRDHMRGLAAAGGDSSGGSLFEDDFEPLLTALAKLPKLKKLSFAEQASESGWNATSETVVTAHVRKVANVQTSPSTPGLTSKERLSDSKQATVRWSDADALFGIFAHPQLSISELVLTTEMPFVAQYLWYSSHLIGQSFYKIQPKLSGLTSLELHLDHGWKCTKWHVLCRGLVQHSRRQLQRLRLAYRPNAAVKGALNEKSVNDILENRPSKPCLMPELKSFELVSLPEITVSKRPARPICHAYDLESFFARHQDTLERVVLGNTISSNGSLTSSLIPAIQGTLDALVQCKKLQQVTWLVNRFKHEPRCKRKGGEPTAGCRLECGVYNNTSGGLGGLADVEDLVEGLGVHLNEERKGWDLGDYVRKQKEQVEGGA
ncbi:hypothetical protein LTR08_008447 [Meristemomyces frigidus]|nr:hypothetical protein LTR08_008447 [Meristemomyces frigidus]